MSMAKCYGRRLVLCRGTKCEENEKIAHIMGHDKVAYVEDDTSVSVLSVQEVYNRKPGKNGGRRRNLLQAAGQDSASQIIKDINYSSMWKAYGTGLGTVVALLDTGVSPARDFGIRHFVNGIDMITDSDLAKDGDGRDYDPSDIPGEGDSDPEHCPTPSWHGTRMAFILAAESNLHGDRAPYGIAPDATVLSMRVLGRCSKGYASDVADSIVWSVGGTINNWPTNVKHKARVVLMPFAGKGPCPSYLQSAVDLAVGAAFNATLVAAAGNDASDSRENFPANCMGVISVGSLDSQGNRAVYSALNADVYAPGDNVRCETNATCSGTSVSSTLVAGAEACGYKMQRTDDHTFWINASQSHVFSQGHITPCSLNCLNYYKIGHTSYKGGIVNCQAGTKYCVDYPACKCCMLCPACSSGYYLSGSHTCDACASCLICIAGTYSTGGSATGCTACTPPMVTTMSGQSSCRYCGFGQYAMTGMSACASCGLGTYWDSDTSGTTVCTDCPSGKVATSTGRSSCSVCGSGSYAYSASQCTACPIGKFWSSSLEGTASCSNCPAGKVSGEGASTCTACGPGKFADRSKPICQECVAGTYSTLAENSVCTPCPAGTYSSVVSARTASVCAGCFGGNYSSQEGSTSCSFCGNDTPGSRPANFTQIGEKGEREREIE